MTAVMLSIKPQWCELIASGEKTLEVRKNSPKLKTPFKCYIYRTKGKVKHILNGKWFNMPVGGSVIGEFICDSIITMSVEYSDTNSRLALKEFYGTCLTDKQIIDYLGNGVTGYAWHISNMKIYGKSKELSEFRRPCANDLLCENCAMFRNRTETCGNVALRLTRPPQSWCYVEELKSISRWGDAIWQVDRSYKLM